MKFRTFLCLIDNRNIQILIIQSSRIVSIAISITSVPCVSLFGILLLIAQTSLGRDGGTGDQAIRGALV